MVENDFDHYVSLVTSELRAENLDDQAGIEPKDYCQPFTGSLPPMGSNSLLSGSDEVNSMISISSNHGRVMVEGASSGRVVWGGPMAADVYGARDLKGTEHSRPWIAVSNYQGQRHFRINGCLDQPAVERIQKASRALRSLGLPTGRLVHWSELLEVAGHSGNISIEEWRQQALAMVEKRYRGSDELMESAKRYLERTRLYEEEREVQVPERVRDLAQCRTERGVKRMLGRIWPWLNVATEARGNGLIVGTPQPKKFSVDNPADVERFMAEWLPTQMGTYLGRVHKNGLILGFAHGQNWSGVGTFCDLDSVAGALIDPKEWMYAYAGIAVDIRRSLGSLEELFNYRNVFWLTWQYDSLLLPAKASFIKAYGRERWDDEERVPDYGTYLDGSFSDGTAGYKRLTTPSEWREILRLMGVPAGDRMDRQHWEREYSLKDDYYNRGVDVVF